VDIRPRTSFELAEADATTAMFSAISPDLRAVWFTDREISLVVAVCSSIALAMALW